MKKAETIRGENWLKISERVLDHIESYAIPQYGDAPNDAIEGWVIEECFKQTERYLSRRNTSMRPKEKALDILKSIHYLSLALEKIEKENLQKLGVGLEEGEFVFLDEQSEREEKEGREEHKKVQK